MIYFILFFKKKVENNQYFSVAKSHFLVVKVNG